MKEKRAGHRTVRPLALWSLLLLCGSASIALRAEQEPTPSKHPQPFALTVEGERLSLTAQDAPIKAVLEDLGRKLHVEIVVKPPQDETITTKFQALTLDQALQRLSERWRVGSKWIGEYVRATINTAKQTLTLSHKASDQADWRVIKTDVPLRTHTNLLKQKENFKNIVATKYLFDSIEKTVTNIRR